MPEGKIIPPKNRGQKEEPIKRARPIIRTFKTDIAEYLKKKDISLTEIAAAQERRRRQYALIAKPDGGFRKKIIIFAAAIILLVAASGFLIFFIKNKQKPSSQAVEPSPPAPILTSQKEVILDFQDGDDMERKISEVLTTNLGPGDLLYLPLRLRRETKKETHFIGAKEFLKFIEAEASPNLTNFLKNSFFLGVLHLKKNYPVLIFESQKGKIENIFAGMLSWEKSLVKDLSFLIPTKKTESRILFPSFTDKIIENNASRIIQAQGETILLYTILNNKYIIITTSEESLKEIIKRVFRYKLSEIDSYNINIS
jgi:hypothetical protein